MMNFKMKSKQFTSFLSFFLWFTGLLLMLMPLTLKCQDRIESISNQLNVLSVDVPGLDRAVELSASKMPIQEFLRSIAIANKLNIIVDPSLNLTITNNFTDVTVKDILIFLAKSYELEIAVSGKILTVSKYNAPVVDVGPKSMKILVDSTTGRITMELKNDSLCNVIHAITSLTDRNIIFTPELQNRLVSVFVKDDSVNDALEKLAISNNLAFTAKDDYYIIYDERNNPSSKQSQSGINSTTKPASVFGPAPVPFQYQVKSLNDISLNAQNIQVIEIINAVSQAARVNYFVYSELKDLVTLNLNHVSYEEFLDHALNGTKCAYRSENDIYLIGERDQQGLRTTNVIKMKYRAINDISKVIPDKMKKDITLQEFPDLNSIIVSGSPSIINEIDYFLQQIDEVVPLVMIEVIIVDFQNGYTLSTGISAGVGDKPVTTKGTVGPGVDITLGASSVNSIINSLNGTGLLNLGKVSSNFYLSLKFLEDQGMVKVRSTPKLATLNGHEAEMKITKTQYYLEETSQIFANASTTQTKVKQYKQVNADFAVTLTPNVSSDNQITLQIKVDQSDFTGTKLDANAPPDQVTRSFTSLIRVKNEEMILLGGLDEGRVKESGSGFPVLSRIPILKWIFSSRDRTKSDSRLNIFIKPTIIY